MANRRGNKFLIPLVLCLELLVIGAGLVFVLGGRGFVYLAGMYGYAIANARPDRLLTYEIDIQLDRRVLTFKGSTHCEHAVNIGPGRPDRYSTNNRFTYLTQDGQQWILDGIDCDLALHGTPRENYRLFEVRSDKDANLFFVTKDSPFRIIKTDFHSRVTVGSKDVQNLGKYNVGPYAFQKIFLKELPPPLDTLLATSKDVTVIRTFASLLCRSPDGSEPVLDRDQFRGLVASIRHYVTAVEEGPLARRDSTGLWELRPSNDLFGPLDVTTWEPDGRNWHSSFDPSLVTCLPISISGVSVLLHANAGSALVYIPSEKAILTVRAVRSPNQLVRHRGGKVELWGY
jgi:hypothetical protein